MTQPPKIVVITPIKNEAWILPRFLAVTSQFADHIIIADQCSTDESKDICARFPKVTLIENRSAEFNEAERQIMLIEKARALVPGPKILLALDADEILAANALQTQGWQSMLHAKSGTILFFEKPDLYITPYQCIRYDQPWPLGYVDDGADHKPKVIHSVRIPMPEYAQRLYLHDIKILHYAHIRSEAQAAKMRLYSLLENIHQTGFVWRRRITYSSKKDYLSAGRLEPYNPDWFTAWEKQGVDMTTITCEKYYWQDYEVLRQFKAHGVKRFWMEDIWNFNWEKCRLFAVEHGVAGIAVTSIQPPPPVVSMSATLITWLFAALTNARRKMFDTTKKVDWL